MSISSVGSGQNSLENSEARQRQARDQIASAEKSVTEAAKDAEITINHIKDEFEKQSFQEQSRQDARLESLRAKGYEQLRDLKRGQQSELNKIRREGEKDLSQ